MCGGKRKDKVV